MLIESASAPPPRKAGRPHLKYNDLIATLASMTSGWLRVPFCDVGGKDIRTKRGTVIQSVRHAGMRVTTRTDADYLYVCRIDDKFAAIDAMVEKLEQ